MPTLIIELNGKRLRVKDGRGLLSGTIGLMLNNFKDIDGCLIKTNSVHTSFCKPLDLFWLDDDFRIMEVQEAYNFGVYSCRKARYCLEVRKGLVKARNGLRAVIKYSR